MQDCGVKVACVTCAEKGAYVASSGAIFFASALVDRDNRVDATGAGDAFTSGFLGGYLAGDQEGDDNELLKKALSFGILNSASVISKVGGHNGLMKASELERDRHCVKIKKLA